MEGITNSERAAAACPQRWLLRYGLGLRPVAYARPLYLGSLVHSGLEALFTAWATPNAEGNSPIGGWPLSHALAAVESAKGAELDARGIDALGFLSPYADPATLDALDVDTATACTLVTGYAATWGGLDDWAILANEITFLEAIRLPENPKRRSKWRVAGKIDKVARINGRIWIIEHKTSAVNLGEWAEKNRRNPQALTYAIALAEKFPSEEIAGVIYDLIQSKAPKAAEALAILKSGKALAKVAGLPWTTAAEFQKAIGALADAGSDPLDGAEWYRETLDALRERDASGFWYRREAVPFEPSQVARVNGELYQAAQTIGEWRKSIEKVAGEGGQIAPEAIPAFLAAKASQWPREASLCYQFNRLCAYASVCAEGSAEAVAGFAITGAAGGHDELATDNGASGHNLRN